MFSSMVVFRVSFIVKQVSKGHDARGGVPQDVAG